MSSFYCGDIVEFEQDHAIVGMIDTTWSDVEIEPNCTDVNVYIHKSTPANVRKVWRKQGRIFPGYVIVEFMLPQDGFCLVTEAFLRLRDRGLAVDDIVKRKPSDVQTGRVLTTSAECTLSPACSMDEYASTRAILAQGHRSSHGQHSRLPHSINAKMHGFPDNDQAKELQPPEESETLTVPAGEVRNFQDYQQDDYVIYEDWIGRVGSILDEITMRLTNGSVVIVENPEELEVPSYIPGTSSYELVQRLDRAGYYCRFQDSELSPKTRTAFPEYFYPGQHVRTKKGNLRRGRWKFGAYDPNVEPQGIVVEVRTVELEVEWLFPNFLESSRAPGPAPPYILDTDILQRGAVKTFNNNRIPLQPLAMTIRTATNENDIDYGTQVRFRDPTGAAVKYGPRFKRIPRAETQDYDINILHVTSTRIKVLVQWQDGSTSEESSVSLIPTRNMDVNDVWPGDKVSLKADETTISTPLTGALGSGEPGMKQSANTLLHARTIGVVQTVNAVERLAKVRWFQNADFKLDIAESSHWHHASPSSAYGYMTEKISEVSLYDISAYDAFYPKLGDLAVACPAITISHPQLVDYFGVVVELCLDGEVIIRCCAVSEPHDIKVGISNLTMVATLDFEGGGDDTDNSNEESDEDVRMSDEMSAATEEEDDRSDKSSPQPVDVQIEYEGGENMDIDEDEDAWNTDDSIPSTSSTPDPPSSLTDELIDSALRQFKDRTTRAEKTLEDDRLHSGEASRHPSNQASAPTPFLILEDDPPTDHHYYGEFHMEATNIAKKATKEQKIMKSSLPDGVFVRTWESRLDLLRVLVIGPSGTPFEHAPFLFDLQLAAPFPDVPPKVFFHSWTNGLGRINPNLYEDGKVCLSLLGTWPADKRNEGWSKKSTVLQIVVSILGLILVKEPYYNEAGFEVFVGSDDTRVSSRIYSEKAFVVAKGFVKAALSNPPGGLLDVVDWLYRVQSGPRLLDQIIRDCRKLSERPLAASPAQPPEDNAMPLDDDSTTMEDSWAKSTGMLSTGALVLLHRHMEWLAEYSNRNSHMTNAATAEPDHGGDTDNSD